MCSRELNTTPSEAPHVSFAIIASVGPQSEAEFELHDLISAAPLHLMFLREWKLKVEPAVCFYFYIPSAGCNELKRSGSVKRLWENMSDFLSP